MGGDGKGKGKGTPKAPPPPRPEGGYPKAKAQDPNDGPTGEGKRVQVAAGMHAGKTATVLKATGEGKEMKWRVAIDDGPSTWVDLVKPLDGELAAPKAGSPPAKASADPLGEGQTVEVVGGPHAGKLGLVMKRTGDGAESRWRVMLHGGGPSTWVDKVKVQGSDGGAATPAEAPKAEDDDKTYIEVATGVHEGKKGYVLKSTGQGAEMRWRVQLDNGPATWVDDVNILGGAKKAAPAEEPAPFGGLPPHIAARLGLPGAGPKAGGAGGAASPKAVPAGTPGGGSTKGPLVEVRLVEVTGGDKAGQRGEVLKVTGAGNERRYQLRLRSGTATWATEVAGVGPNGQVEVVIKPRWPVSGPGSDDGEGETDDEMPDLIDPLADDNDAESVATDPDMPELVWPGRR